MPTRPGSNSDSLFNDASPRTPNYSRVSSFRSPELEVLLYSPHIHSDIRRSRCHRRQNNPGSNCVSGRVVLNASGAFISDGGGTGKQRHIFFSASKVIHVASVSDASRKGIRQMFAGRSRQSRSTSIAVDSATRTFPFMFDFRCNRRAGEILPTTLYPSDSKSLAVEVSYQITATWEPLKLTETPSSLIDPIIVQPDPDFHSLELGGQGSWIEIPLSSHRPVPIRCAVRLIRRWRRPVGLPDGLYKDTIPLGRDILTSFNWGGISVKDPINPGRALVPQRLEPPQ
ncbi:hypothetical protein B0H14DRAFT_2585646 [Mycena olivaceomarginata]|nr:hypothetical protein B0H14DRAFT_2585646 [Mycena olivaceomarginata]